jgi:hypothetical protein
MLPIIRLSQAWLDAHGWSLAEGASFLELDQANAVPAGAGDVCPQCARPHTEYQGDVFVPDSATVTSEHEHGRAYVLCLCGATYWYAAVDALNEPISEARVRAASVTRTPTTRTLQTSRPEPPPRRGQLAAGAYALTGSPATLVHRKASGEVEIR